MRSGGSVLKALSAAEGALPREHRPRAGCVELTRALSASYRNKLHIGTEKALRYVGEPFLYVLELANLNLDGIAGMRSGGSVLKATGPFTYWGTDEGALPREHRPRCRLRRTVPRASSACRSRGAGGAPSSRQLAHSLIGAPQRGYSPASSVREPVVRNCTASGNRCAVIGSRSTSPGSRAVPANATGDGA